MVSPQFCLPLVSHSHKNFVSCTTLNLFSPEIQFVSISLWVPSITSSAYFLWWPLKSTSLHWNFIPLGCRLYLNASAPYVFTFLSSILEYHLSSSLFSFIFKYLQLLFSLPLPHLSGKTQPSLNSNIYRLCCLKPV